MRHLIFIFLSLIVCSCSNYSDCYECYIDQFPKDQQEVINELETVFEDFLLSSYPEYSTNEERLRLYSKDLFDTNFREKYDREKIEKLLIKYKGVGLPNEFKDWENNYINYTGLYFKAQQNCLEYDYRDSLVYNYLKGYEVAGDISPHRFVEYIANEADNRSLKRRILQHQFIMEYFVPRMINK